MNKLFSTSLVAAGAIAATFAVTAPEPAKAQSAERVIGTILNGVLNNGRTYNYGRYPNGNYGYGNYGLNERAAVDRCARAVEARLDREYRNNRYNRSSRYNPYDRYNRNYRSYDHGARVTGVQDVRRTRNGLKVYGLASTGYQTQGRGYGAVSDLRWNCDISRNGRIRDTDVDRVRTSRYNNRYYRY